MTPPGLLKISTTIDATATAPGVPSGAAINVDVLQGAQGLAQPPARGGARCATTVKSGLNFQLPDKPYWVYWGDGADVERKLEVLAAANGCCDRRSGRRVIDVRYERPYIK